MSISNSSVVTVRSPADLLTLVPYLLSFHPSDSLVLIAVADKRVRFAGRCDLPTPGADQTQLRDALARMASVTARENATALLVGYGPAAQVTPALDAAIATMTARGVQIREALRVTDGRYFSYLCDNEDCCPSHGTAFDPTTSAVAAAVTVAGFVALPDRATLSAQVAPVDGAERQAMNQATERALMRLSEAAAAVEAATVPKDASALICQWGIDAVRRAFDRYQHGLRLSDDETAELTLLLTHPPVRDYAWVHGNASDEHLRLWTDLTRRARPDLAAAPASLLAFTAWRCGDGALANVALDRALTADPDYGMAQLLLQALQAGLSPSQLGDWATLATEGLAVQHNTP